MYKNSKKKNQICNLTNYKVQYVSIPLYVKKKKKTNSKIVSQPSSITDTAKLCNFNIII